MKFRIVNKNGKFYIKKKGILFWSYVEDCYMYGTGILSFNSEIDAEIYLRFKHTNCEKTVKEIII